MTTTETIDQKLVRLSAALRAAPPNTRLQEEIAVRRKRLKELQRGVPRAWIENLEQRLGLPLLQFSSVGISKMKVAMKNQFTLLRARQNRICLMQMIYEFDRGWMPEHHEYCKRQKSAGFYCYLKPEDMLSGLAFSEVRLRASKHQLVRDHSNV